MEKGVQLSHICTREHSGVGVHREIQGKVTEFGVSGVLYNSDLVLYDNGQTLHRRDAFEGPRFMKCTRVFLPADRFPVPD